MWANTADPKPTFHILLACHRCPLKVTSVEGKEPKLGNVDIYFKSAGVIPLQIPCAPLVPEWAP